MIRTISITALALALGGLASCPLTARAEEQPLASPTDEVVELYKRANEAYDAGQLPEAEAIYRRAWAIRKSYDIASNLGSLELDLHKPAAAAELLTYAIQQFPANGSKKTLAAIQARLDEARGLACTLHLKVSEASADIQVDGRFVGRAPLTDAVFVDPGARTIRVKLGDRSDERVITAKAGADRTLAFTLPPSPAPIARPAVAVKETPIVSRRSRIPAVVTGGLGLAALGVGGALIGLAESSRSDANALHDSIVKTPGGCSARAADCDTLRATTSHVDQLGNAGIGVMVLGGALVGAATAYMLWPASKPAPGLEGASRARKASSVTKIQASFGASPTGAGLTLRGSF